MHKYVMVGVQGCGKGTQANLLSEDFDLVHISVGDLFRWNIKNHTKLAARVKRLIAAGKLVDDSIVNELVSRRLAEHDWRYGFILDGFPRNRAQAEFCMENYDVDAVIHIEVPDEIVKERVLARRLCRVCGRDYNLIHHPPQKTGVCDVCEGNLIQRADDNEKALNDRLQQYHNETEPVLDMFRKKERVIDANGSKCVIEVQNQIRRALNLPLRHQDR